MARMSPKLSFGPVMTDYLEGINFARMREERAAKARQVLKKRGVPAILVTGEPNVRYLVGFTWVEFQPHLAYCLFFAEHEPIVFAPPGSYHQMYDQEPWIKNWRPARCWLGGVCGPEAMQEEAKLFAKEIRAELKKRGLVSEKLGIVGFDAEAREALRNAGINVVEGYQLLLEASKTKTVDEVKCLKMAASMCTTGWQKFIDVCRPGMNSSVVNRIVGNTIMEAGAEHAGGDIMSGPVTFERSITLVGRIIESGDLVYYPLCGTRYMGYTACCYRTFKVGQLPTDKEKGWFNKLKDTLDRAIEATRIGNTTADAAKAFPPASTWGYKDEVEVLTVEYGHGVGIVSIPPRYVGHNWPAINRQWSLKHPLPFEKDMVIAYEALEGEHRVGGVRMENMVLITENGPEIMDYFPRDKIIPVGII